MENTETTQVVDKQPVYSFMNSLKNQFTEYMLKNHNITFLDDETERRLYDILLGAGIAFITPYIYKYFLG
jgi:hypothetical protein